VNGTRSCRHRSSLRRSDVSDGRGPATAAPGPAPEGRTFRCVPTHSGPVDRCRGRTPVHRSSAVLRGPIPRGLVGDPRRLHPGLAGEGEKGRSVHLADGAARADRAWTTGAGPNRGRGRHLRQRPGRDRYQHADRVGARVGADQLGQGPRSSEASTSAGERRPTAATAGGADPDPGWPRGIAHEPRGSVWLTTQPRMSGQSNGWSRGRSPSPTGAPSCRRETFDEVRQGALYFALASHGGKGCWRGRLGRRRSSGLGITDRAGRDGYRPQSPLVGLLAAEKLRAS
jgi:hypothetical protein